MSSKQDDLQSSYFQTFGLFFGIGTQIVALVIGGLFGGQYLDDKLGTEPWLLLLGILLGCALGFYNMVRILNLRKKGKKSD